MEFSSTVTKAKRCEPRTARGPSEAQANELADFHFPVCEFGRFIIPIILKTDGPVGEAWTEVREGRKSVRDGAAEAAQKLNDLLKQLAA